MYEVTIYNGDKETVIHSSDASGKKLTSGVIKEEINMIDSFSLSMYMNNPGYGKLKPLTTQIKVFNTQTGEYEFEGRVLFPTDTMESSGLHSTAFICEAELGFLNDSTQTHGEYHDITVRDFLQVMIDNHNRDVADDPIDKTFQVGIVDVDSSTGTLYRYLGYEKTFESIEDKLLDRLGGELRVRKEDGVRYLDYVQAIGGLEETKIKLAKNLQSITKEVDPTDIITRLRPLGARIESEDEEATDASEARITIESVNGGKDYLVDEVAELALGTIVVGSEVFDGVNEPAILKTKGKEHLDSHNRLKVQHSLSALDLSIIGKAPGKFKVGSWYPTFNPVMGIDEPLRIVAKTTDILEPWNNGLTIGDKLKTASQYQADANKQMRMVGQLQSRVNSLGESNVRLSQSLNVAKSELEQVQEDLLNIDIDNLPVELQGIAQQLVTLQDTIDTVEQAVNDIPTYELATNLTSGLMHFEDKRKLDLIHTTKLINLESLENRVKALEEINEGI